ncbi:MAG: replication factor C large subunit, partial [Nanoarchaeota archaeon]|nr:replication factor C large subunit [Nanoarchaeota archaeon]
NINFLKETINMKLIWTEKYRPKSLGEVQGHGKSLLELKEFIENYKKGAALIYGRVGGGKTCSVYAVAKELDLEVLEVNSSDVRNKKGIESVIGNSAKQMSLFSKGKLILIDEIDILSGTKDRGCVQALAKIISDSKHPIVMTAEDPYNRKLSGIRRKCKLIELSTLSYLSVFNILKRICDAEKIKYDEDVLKDLARRSGGDVRSSINDLQTICVTKKVLDSLDELGEREQRDSILNALKLIFKSKSPENVLRAFDKTDLNLNDCLLWLDENLPKEYKDYDLMNAYEAVSRADVFKGRIMRWQHWRFLVYINSLLTAGVALAKKEKNKEDVSYKPTTRILKLWKAKMKYGKRNAIAEKVAAATHSSTKRVLTDTLPYLRFIFKKRQGQEIIDQLELSEDEVEWLSY